jgi:hypothetical protein
MELLVKPEILTSYILYMDLRLATLKSVSFYFPHNVSTLNQCRKLSCGTLVCKHFASYQGYPNYRWDLIRYAKGYPTLYDIPPNRSVFSSNSEGSKKLPDDVRLTPKHVGAGI